MGAFGAYNLGIKNRNDFGVVADLPANSPQGTRFAFTVERVRTPGAVVPPELSLAWFAPRGVGLTAWTGDEKRQTKIRRRFQLLGQTLDGMRVWDIRRAIQTIHFTREGDAARHEHGRRPRGRVP